MWHGEERKKAEKVEERMTKEEAISIISGYEVYGCGYCLQGGDEVEEALRLAVDALRQETVIRCKDCKFYEPENCQCKMVIGTWFPEEYCNSSMRKEE